MYGNVKVASDTLKPLRTDVTSTELLSARKAIHNHLWGGGGASYTDVYRVIIELVLCRYHDECTTRKGAAYAFQQLQGESAAQLADRMRRFCKNAAEAAGTTIDAPFDKVIQSPEKLAHAIKQFAGISFTSNALSNEADILGDFFEATLGTEFKQSKGQFFTHKHITSFALRLAGLGGSAAKALGQQDPRWPRIIDPSCGSGTFLVEALRQIRDSARAFKAQSCASLSPQQEEALRPFDEDSLIRKWADGLFYGIDAHQDLGLGCKVNMLMHKASAKHIFVRDALSKLDLNSVPMGKFDLVATNPPFSVTLSAEERDELKDDYTLLQQGRPSASVASEHLFLERWHQLLREGGNVVAVVPESLLDTKANLQARKFLFQHFNLQAVVSLPSVAFQPYTPTKTVVILAQKKTEAEASLWDTAVNNAALLHGTDEEACFRAALKESAGTAEIFMAEPASVGYKRRGNAPDLKTDDDLMNDVGESVLSRWNDSDRDRPQSRQFGFWVPLADVAARPSLRVDPKYMWLWSVHQGMVEFDNANPERCVPLSDLLTAYRPASIDKGALDPPRTYVEAGTFSSPKTSEMVLSEGEKLEFGDSELAIHGVTANAIRNAPAESWIGSASWKLFNTTDAVDVDYLHGLMKTPPFREAMDCIWSGMGPGRVLPAELLALKVTLPTMAVQCRQGKKFKKALASIEQLHEQIRQREKDTVDSVLRSISRSG